LLQSNWYQERWGSRFTLTGDQNAKERYNNSAGGYRIATSVGGVGTGEGGDRFVIDDPHNIKTVESDLIREGTIYWWRTVVPTRLNDPKKSSFVIIMQRSHDKDLAGYIKDSLSDLTCLVLPAEFDPRSRCVTPLGWKDPRRKIGQLLWEDRFDRKEVENLKRTLGSYAASAQLQQRPSPAEGGIFRRSWWGTYHEVPKRFDFIALSWDMSFKALRESDYVAGHAYGVIGADKYLLDRVNEHLTFTETLAAVRKMKCRWPEAGAIYVEDKANGTAAIDTLRHEIPGLIAVSPTESKESRAFAVSPEVEAGNVYLPAPKLCPWVDEFIEQLARFPRAEHDDDVDAFTQFMLQARRRMGRMQDLAPVVGTTKESLMGVGSNMGRRF
jgi:predicted phage terminase large subunit-like protein